MIDRRLTPRKRMTRPVPSLLDTISSHANNYTLIRWVLASSVVYYHAFHLSSDKHLADRLTLALLPTTSVGGLAVQCFFFLSGLFVAQSWLRDRNVLAYAARRALRIWPGLLVCVALTLPVAALLSQPGQFGNYLAHPQFHEYIAYNGILQFKYQVIGMFSDHYTNAINGSIHTLWLETKMYMLLGTLGLLGMLGSERRIALVSGALVAFACIWPLFTKQPLPINDHDQHLVAMFCAGMLTFGLARHLRIAVWQALPLAALATFTKGPLHTFAFFAFAAWILLYLGQARWIPRRLHLREDHSYGIYIYGWPCGQFVVALAPDIGPLALTAVSLPLAWLLAMASWRYVEKPAMGFGRDIAARFTNRKKETANEASETIAKPRRWPAATPLVAMLAALHIGTFAAARWTSRHPPEPALPMATSIIAFGPDTARAGKRMNPLWLKVDSQPDPATRVIFDGRPLPTVVGDKLVTAKVPRWLLLRPGQHEISLQLHGLTQTQRSNSVTLVVTPGE